MNSDPPIGHRADHGAGLYKPIASRNTAGTPFNKTRSQAADGVPNAKAKKLPNDSPDNNPSLTAGRLPSDSPDNDPTIITKRKGGR